MKVLFVLTQTPGLSWYRCVSYLKYMDIKTVVWPKYVVDKLPNWDMAVEAGMDLIREIEGIAKDVDVIVSQRINTLKSLSILVALRQKYGMPLLLEIDDDAFNVDSSNPAYRTIHPDSDSQYWFKDQLKESDGVITSTEQLKKLYLPFNKNIHVIRNGIDFDVWGKLKPPKKLNKGIKIGWQGAWAHYEDLTILAPVIPKILKKYKDVEFHFFGFRPDFLESCGKFHEMQTIDKYPQRVVDERIDIWLAPLKDTLFNRGKSNIRVLEAGAMGAPVVASKNRNLPYAQTIVHGVTGFLAESTKEWVDSIGKLIESSSLREQMGGNLQEQVWTTFNVKNIAKEYQEVLYGFHRHSSGRGISPGQQLNKQPNKDLGKSGTARGRKG
jgi:glycosyltransferase involved in cell wall biosynthesis